MTENSLSAAAFRDPARAIRDGFECLPEGVGHRLRLWGPLPSDWAGNFALHAFVAGIRVVSGDAMRTSEGAWQASLLIESADPADVLRHDFLNMARRAPRLVPDLPEPVVQIGVSLSRALPGDVYARVSGKDSIGLVAHVLRRFGRYGLRPRRFMLRTLRGEVADWFWLERDASASETSVEEMMAEWGAPH